jgi:hypothetical protein
VVDVLDALVAMEMFGIRGRVLIVRGYRFGKELSPSAVLIPLLPPNRITLALPSINLIFIQP